MPRPSTTVDIHIREAGYGLLCILSILAVPIGQGVSIIAFDTTGVDQYVPGWAIYLLGPALLVTALPAVLGTRLYGSRRALWSAAGVFVGFCPSSLSLPWSFT